MCDIETIEDWEALMEQMKNVKYDKKLAKFFSTYTNDIEDLTE